MKQLALPKPNLHIFVCVNNRYNIPTKNHSSFPSCAPTIDNEIVKKFKLWLQKNNLTNQVFCTKTGCLGFCNKNGGVAVIYPSGDFYSEINSLEDLKCLVKKYIK